MKYLYVDNFRGFRNAYIPIKNVSFLVGENSTGKTSILTLVKILSSPKFWFNQSFDIDEVRMGHFQDLVSIHASDKNYFRIGMAEKVSSTETRGKPTVIAFLMTFIEARGLPALSKFTYLLDEVSVTLQFSTRRVSYKTEPVDTPEDLSSFMQGTFATWLTQHQQHLIKNLEKLADRKEFRSGPEILESWFRIDQKLRASSKRSPRGFRVPGFGEELVYLAPIRSKPHRTYDEYSLEFSPEGDHIPYVIKKILGTKTDASRFSSFIERIGQSSGLFEGIKVKRYGRSGTAPFELDVVLNQKALSVSNVGYGVAQSLPVFVEMFARPKGSWLAIQQPEVHLHPRAQAAMGDVLFELSTLENKSFLIETHSDYLVDRFRQNFRTKEKKPDSQVLFFERHETGNRVVPLDIDPAGDLPQDQPPSYRSFFIREEMRVLGLQ